MVVSLFSKGGGIVLPSTVFCSKKTYLFWFEQIFRRKQRDCAQGYHLYYDEYHKNYTAKCSGNSSALSILNFTYSTSRWCKNIEDVEQMKLMSQIMLDLSLYIYMYCCTQGNRFLFSISLSGTPMLYDCIV